MKYYIIETSNNKNIARHDKGTKAGNGEAGTDKVHGHSKQIISKYCPLYTFLSKQNMIVFKFCWTNKIEPGPEECSFV